LVALFGSPFAPIFLLLRIGRRSVRRGVVLDQFGDQNFGGDGAFGG
jgi:hypothetical protein